MATVGPIFRVAVATWRDSSAASLPPPPPPPLAAAARNLGGPKRIVDFGRRASTCCLADHDFQILRQPFAGYFGHGPVGQADLHGIGRSKFALLHPNRRRFRRRLDRLLPFSLAGSSATAVHDLCGAVDQGMLRLGLNRSAALGTISTSARVFDFELHVGSSNTAYSFKSSIVGADHHRVGHDVLRHRGVEPNLRDLAAKHFVRKRVDRERDRHVRLSCGRCRPR